MARTLAKFVSLLVLWCFTGSTYGLGLGEITLNSHLNQPLDAEISLSKVGGLTQQEILAGLAEKKDFAAAGVERTFLISQLRFRVRFRDDGTGYIKVTSGKPIREPFLNFLVEVHWPSGRLLREYTLLLDPPMYRDSAAVMANAPQKQQVASTLSSTNTVSRQSASSVDSGSGLVGRGELAPLPTPPGSGQQGSGAAASGSSGGFAPSTSYQPSAPLDSYKVQKSDTLGGIAKSMRRSGYDINQTMIALLRKNPDAFVDNNINRLKEGEILRAPTESDLSEVSREDAIAEVAEQAKLWRAALRRGQQSIEEDELSAAQLNTSEDSITTNVDEDLGGGRVTLVSPGADDGYSDSDSDYSYGEGEGAGNASIFDEEERDRRALAIEDLKDKIANLEQQVKLSQTILSEKEGVINVQDNEISQLTAELERTKAELAKWQDAEIVSTSSEVEAPISDAKTPEKAITDIDCNYGECPVEGVEYYSVEGELVPHSEWRAQEQYYDALGNRIDIQGNLITSSEQPAGMVLYDANGEVVPEEALEPGVTYFDEAGREVDMNGALMENSLTFDNDNTEPSADVEFYDALGNLVSSPDFNIPNAEYFNAYGDRIDSDGNVISVEDTPKTAFYDEFGNEVSDPDFSDGMAQYYDIDGNRIDEEGNIIAETEEKPVSTPVEPDNDVAESDWMSVLTENPMVLAMVVGGVVIGLILLVVLMRTRGDDDEDEYDASPEDLAAVLDSDDKSDLDFESDDQTMISSDETMLSGASLESDDETLLSADTLLSEDETMLESDDITMLSAETMLEEEDETQIVESEEQDDDLTEMLDQDDDEGHLALLESDDGEPVDEPSEELGDVLGEADIYIAYGRFQQAIDMLRSAAEKNPERADIKAKLLDVFAENNDVEAFKEVAADALEMGDPALEQKVNDLSEKLGIDPNESGSEPEPEEESVADSPSVTDVLQEEEEDGLDFDTDMTNINVTQLVAMEDNDDEDGPSLEDLERDLSTITEDSEDDSDDLGDLSDLDMDDDIQEVGDDLGVAASDDDPLADLDEDQDDVLSQLDQELSEAEQEEDGVGDLGSIDLDDEAVSDEASDLAASLDDDLDADLDVEELAADEEVSANEEPAAVEEPSEDEMPSEDLGDLDMELDEAPAVEDAADTSDELPDLDLGEVELDESETEAESNEAAMELDDDLDASLNLGESAEVVDEPAEAANELEESEAEEGLALEADFGDASSNLGGEEDVTDINMVDLGDNADEAETKLDLARAYIDMGDRDGAKDILDEVVTEGNEDQQKEAKELLQKCG